MTLLDCGDRDANFPSNLYEKSRLKYFDSQIGNMLLLKFVRVRIFAQNSPSFTREIYIYQPESFFIRNCDTIHHLYTIRLSVMTCVSFMKKFEKEAHTDDATSVGRTYTRGKTFSCEEKGKLASGRWPFVINRRSRWPKRT